MFLYKTKYILILFVVIFLSNCSVNITIISLDQLPESDYSFEVNAQAVEKGTIVSILEHSSGQVSFPSSPTPEADILLTGKLKMLRGPTEYFWIFPRFVRLKYQEERTFRGLPRFSMSYEWQGSIIVNDNQEDAFVRYTAYADENGNGKEFILKKASLGLARLDFADPFEITDSNDDFPFLIGYVFINKSKYSLYAVLDNSPSRNMFSREVFFNPLQKFQFIDEQKTVVAELEKDIYTIYDTLPEEEIIFLKNAIGLFVAFRHSADVVRNINDAW